MWLIGEYLPTSLFSLRSSTATNAAAKTLLLPSPYCVKMALLDASFRIDGVAITEARFEWIKRLLIRIEPPKHAIVNGCFVTIQKLRDDRRFGPAFALREYVAYGGNLRLAFEVTNLLTENEEILKSLLVQINQLGKRGCFVQLLTSPVLERQLPSSFAVPAEDVSAPSTNFILQALDDMQPDATLSQVNSFSGEPVSRRSVRTVVAYLRRESSKSFVAYERVVTF